jgi:hypothetical protein
VKPLVGTSASARERASARDAYKTSDPAASAACRLGLGAAEVLGKSNAPRRLRRVSRVSGLGQRGHHGAHARRAARAGLTRHRRIELTRLAAVLAVAHGDKLELRRYITRTTITSSTMRSATQHGHPATSR